MWELIIGLGKLTWAMVSSAFLLHKQLSGIQNDFLAAALGVSPIVITILGFLVGRLIKYVKST